METVGFAALQIIPSLKGIQGNLQRDLGAPLVAAGKKAGKDTGDAIASGLKSAEVAAKKAADAVEKARNKEADAAGKVRVAEAQLQSLRDKGVTDAGRLAAAEERVNKAKRDSEAASKSVQQAESNHAQSLKDVEAAANASADAVEDVGKKSLISGEMLVKFGAVAAAGVAAAGTALFKLGSDFADMSNTIRIGTGASGEALDGLVGIAKNLGSQVPASFEDIGSTVADLNTRLGLTGAPLETLSRQFLELNNMGIETDINGIAASFQAFGVTGADTAGALDELFQVSQATGLGVNELAAAAVKGGPALRDFGFGLGESAALAGTLDKAGLDATSTFAAMQRAMVNFAKDGKSGEEALFGTVSEIENFIAAGDQAAAIDLAGKVFGTRGAAQFVDAVKMGTLSVDDFVSATGATEDTILGLADETRTFSDQWVMFKNEAMAALEPVATRVFDTITKGMAWIKDNAVPAVREFADWIGRNKPLLTDLGIAIGVVTAALTAMVVQQKIAAAGSFTKFITGIITSTKAWTVAQTALNFVLNANPIGIIVTALAALVAAIVIAYRNSETFRNIVQGAWEGIKTAISAAWTGVIQPVWEAIKVGLSALGDAFSWVWNSVIKPTWDGLGAGIAWVYHAVLVPTWDALKSALASVGDFFVSVWHNVIKPTWDALGAGIQWVWNSIINPTWEALKAGLGLVQDAFSFAWNNVIKPVWDALGAGIKWVWDNVVNPVWEAFKSGLSTLQSSFETAVGFIGSVWDRIKAIVAAPVRFVVETVYNNGIRSAWNKVAGFLGLDDLAPVDLGLLGAYASGGVIPGYTPGRDTGLIAVGGGEAVMRPEWTKAMGSDYVDGANAAARMGGVQGVKKFMGAFANGGIVESIVGLVNQHFPGMTITSTYRNSNDHHGAGKAVDFSDGTDSTPGMKAAAQWFYENYGGSLLELIHSPFGNNVKDGSNVGDGFGFYGADTMAAHRNHVHVAAPFALDPSIAGQMDPSIWDRIKGAAASAVQSLRSVVARLFDGVMDPIGNAIPSFGDSQIGKLPKLAFDKFRTSVRDWILGQADQRGGSSGGSFDVAPGTGPVADQVREAFSAYGWGDGAQWDAAQWIIGKESSWNPTARNPDSGAFGLFQFLGGTKDQYLPDENPNPRIQGDAGARYIRDRYGDPLAAKAFWEQNGWYDQGGLASGVGVMLKNVIQPERVLSPEMTKHFERLVDVMEKPEFIDALTKLAPAGADAPDAQPGGSTTAPAPVGGTGVDATYTSEENTDWGARASKIGSDFLSANVDQFKSDLGLPSGDGFISQLAKQGVKVVEEHIHYHVTNIDEAMRKERERRQKEALTFSRRG